jgi:hypothetical protein
VTAWHKKILTKELDLALNVIAFGPRTVAQGQLMMRCGASAHTMRSLVDDDIFFLRLKLLVIMAKAILKCYPLGELRKAAVIENARLIFYQTLSRCALKENRPASDSMTPDTRLLYPRAQLLAVMVRSLVENGLTGSYRRQALCDNIDKLCELLAEPLHLVDIPILKVA